MFLVFGAHGWSLQSDAIWSKKLQQREASPNTVTVTKKGAVQSHCHKACYLTLLSLWAALSSWCSSSHQKFDSSTCWLRVHWVFSEQLPMLWVNRQSFCFHVFWDCTHHLWHNFHSSGVWSLLANTRNTVQLIDQVFVAQRFILVDPSPQWKWKAWRQAHELWNQVPPHSCTKHQNI